MKKKMKRFEEGGLSTEQEEWLGGADRTDPIIMARMRAAVPDAPTKASTYGEQDEMPEVKTEALKNIVKTASKPKAEPKAEPKGDAADRLRNELNIGKTRA